MQLSQVAQSNPDILGGTAVFVGTRVPVQSLFDHLEGGDTMACARYQDPGGGGSMVHHHTVLPARGPRHLGGRLSPYRVRRTCHSWPFCSASGVTTRRSTTS